MVGNFKHSSLLTLQYCSLENESCGKLLSWYFPCYLKKILFSHRKQSIHILVTTVILWCSEFKSGCFSKSNNKVNNTSQMYAQRLFPPLKTNGCKDFYVTGSHVFPVTPHRKKLKYYEVSTQLISLLIVPTACWLKMTTQIF